MKLKVLREPLAEGLRPPFYAYPGDAGLQLVTAESVVISPGSWAPIKTGLRVLIPPGHYGAVLSRGVSATLGVGFDLEVVDSPYTGPLTLVAWNKSSEPVYVQRGAVLGQMVILPFVTAEVEELTPEEFGAEMAKKEGEGQKGHI